ncbi:MAG: hypothetical protein RJQ04_07760 [Longimicrobiales bacterium]
MNTENTARAFWVREPGTGELRTAPLPVPPEGHVQVRTLFSGISRGTEALVFRGGVPADQRAAMRAPFQEGEFPGPVKYGYMNVGVVDSVGPEVDPAWQGRVVFSLYPHQDRFHVPVAAVTPVPDGVPAGRAVLAANLETAVTGVWDAGLSVGDRLVVVGGGVVGCLVARLAGGVPGVRVTLVDPDPSRTAVARALGVSFAPGPPDGPPADVVIHASGHPEGARDALGLLADEGLLVEMSWFGNQDVALPLGRDFHSRRLRIRSSQVGRIPPERVPRWTPDRRRALVMDLLRDDALDHLISGESPFEELPAVMARLAADGTGVLCHRIRYDAPPGSHPG